MRYVFQFSIGNITEQHTRDYISVDSAMSHAITMLKVYRVPQVDVIRPGASNNIPDHICTVYAAAIQ